MYLGNKLLRLSTIKSVHLRCVHPQKYGFKLKLILKLEYIYTKNRQVVSLMNLLNWMEFLNKRALKFRNHCYAPVTHSKVSRKLYNLLYLFYYMPSTFAKSYIIYLDVHNVSNWIAVAPAIKTLLLNNSLHFKTSAITDSTLIYLYIQYTFHFKTTHSGRKNMVLNWRCLKTEGPLY